MFECWHIMPSYLQMHDLGASDELECKGSSAVHEPNELFRR